MLAWYDKHRREMPWRAGRDEIADPYRVALSEVMLQQTTVATVGPYFLKFIERWPTLESLASAKLDDVLKMWAGLGYYRRARMLHACAQKIVSEFGGKFPDDEKKLRELPGFGPYTAAAVAAIAYGRRANAVDGNVERVMARIHLIRTPLPKAKKELAEAAEKLIPPLRCGDYAQALMDLGATVCTPRQPKCALCPWKALCRARAEGEAEKLPRRAAKKRKPTRRTMAFALFNGKGEIYLRRRPAKGLLGGMMEVPSAPWAEGAMPGLSAARRYAPSKEKWEVLRGAVRHVFTHFTLEAAVAVARTTKKLRGHWVAPEKLNGEALPSAMKKIAMRAIKSRLN